MNKWSAEVTYRVQALYGLAIHHETCEVERNTREEVEEMLHQRAKENKLSCLLIKLITRVSKPYEP